jgi:hypothetical protein
MRLAMNAKMHKPPAPNIISTWPTGTCLVTVLRKASSIEKAAIEAIIQAIPIKFS